MAAATSVALVSGLTLARYFLWNRGNRARRKMPGQILGAPASVGHRLRDLDKNPLPQNPLRTESIACVIVGGGMSGLSAAWRLQKKGFTDFTLLELDSEVGGNSRSGKSEVSAYPWGAHYVPIPNEDSVLVKELFEELGVITGYDSQTRLPVYNETYLCADPQERLLFKGRWHEGLFPQFGVSAADQAQYQSFLAEMELYRVARGRDEKPAFSIPLEGSSKDPLFRELDQISMQEYLEQKGWDSPHLRWYVNYCCRDDYGSTLDQVSAWAGIHYFAGRSGRAANAAPQSVLTWPEGNGWLVKQLQGKVIEKIRTGALVYKVKHSGEKIHVDYLDQKSQQPVRLIADQVIFAAPRFIADRVVEGLKPSHSGENFHYVPWMVANVSLDTLPGGTGAPLSWDNVSYHSKSLGYVVATHQKIARYAGEKTVITFYYPLSDELPEAARKSASTQTLEHWQELVVQDLARMHPGIEPFISRVDVWLWGHGMIQPRKGFIWGSERARATVPQGSLRFAHSDMSGISIFEEAQYWGVRAADQVLA